ncbi:MAG: hypothetical protein ACRCZF_23230, partial [Gemmataceae bacterium]
TVQKADATEAIDTRSTTRVLVLIGGLVVTLAAFFLIVRAQQFQSLTKRALFPLRDTSLATRTTLTITEPVGGDGTVTAGTEVRIRVSIDGRIPDATAEDRVRVKLRYQPDADSYEEVDLQPGDSNRDWEAKLPDHLVQNGFWYHIVGGDGQTPEHRLQVRSRPLIQRDSVRYEYPNYLRLNPEVTTEPQLEGFRGTQVTLEASTNRSLARGEMYLQGQPVSIPAEIVGEKKETLRFRITLRENGLYRLMFTSTDGETSTDTPAAAIRVLVDEAPIVRIQTPATEDITLPPTDRLTLDATVGDDFGIDQVIWRFRRADNKQALAPRPYNRGQSFRRDADQTYPTAVEIKDSVILKELRDEAGRPLLLPENMVIEYWLEATDNCTEPKANIGRSAIQRVKVGPMPTPMAPPKPDEKRAQTEAKHQADQQKKLQKEDRPKPAQPRPENQQPPKGSEN